AELEIRGEGVGELLERGGAAGLRSGQQRGELLPGGGVGIVLDPALGAGAQGGVDVHAGASVAASAAGPGAASVIRRTVSASRREMRGPAACPASSTSSWLSASPLIPAARFVTREMPSRSIPASRTAIASSAVDMPTRCAPTA